MKKVNEKNKVNKKLQSNLGITLIALVISIIVLLILAGVSIATLTGDNGILTQATKAKNTYEDASIEEQIELYRFKAENDKSTLKDKLIKDELLNKEEIEKKGIVNLSENIIVISNFEGLKEISKKVEEGESYQGKKIYMINDINCSAKFDSETGELIEGENFMPIGDSNSKIEEEGNSSSIKKEFKGKFDGFGYKISNLYIKENETTDYCTALFGYVGSEGIIKNLTVSNSYIHGYYEVGAIVGRNRGEIINCVNEGIVITDSYLVGGIAGRNTNIIDKCINRGKVKGVIQTGRNCRKL